MALDYSDTGHFLVLGNELSIAEVAARVWRYTRKINASWPGSGNPYFRSVLNTIYVNTAQPNDEAETESKNALHDEMEPDFQSIHERRKSTVLEGIVLPFIANAMELDQGTIDEGPIIYEYNEELLNSTGQVSVIRFGGILGKLRTQMSADNEHIRENVVTLGAITAVSGNTGQLTELTVGGGRSHALTGKLRMHCVDDTVGRTKLTLDNVLTEMLPNGDEMRSGDNQITVGTDYDDGPTGIALQIRYVALVESGDNGNIVSAPDWDTPNETDSDKGKLYLKVTRVHATGPTPPIWLLEWYNNANRQVENLVGSSTSNSITGTEVITIPGQESNLSFTFDRAAANTLLPSVGNTDQDIMWDLKVPRVGEEWTKTVTNDEAGLFATKVAKTWPATLNTTANATPPSIPDTLAPNFVIAAP